MEKAVTLITGTAAIGLWFMFYYATYTQCRVAGGMFYCLFATVR